VKPETKEKIAKKSKRIANKIRRKNGHVKRGFRQRVIFKLMGKMQKAGLSTPRDVAYWKEQGWI